MGNYNSIKDCAKVVKGNGNCGPMIRYGRPGACCPTECYCSKKELSVQDLEVGSTPNYDLWKLCN